MKLKFLVSGVMIPAFTLSLMGAGFPDPPAQQLAPSGAKKATAVLAGGCFWGMQGVFEHVKGVTETVVGYAGGKANTAKYPVVEEGNTNHAESIRITYDPSRVSYGDLLKIYFSVAHDPTTLNRQHNDVGTQYRSAIFYANDEQKNTAEQYIKILNGAHVFKGPIVTQVVPLFTADSAHPTEQFFRGEEYHQHYLDQVQACGNSDAGNCGNLNSGYIRAFDVPMVMALQKTYPDFYVKEIH